MACSTNYTVLQQTLIQNYNKLIRELETSEKPNAPRLDRTPANRNITDYLRDVENSIICMTEYLNSHQVNPQQDFSQLRNTYYNVIVPMRKQIEIGRDEAKNLNGQGDIKDHRFEMEKQNYNATVYIYIMLTILATVLLYYVLLNIVR